MSRKTPKFYFVFVFVGGGCYLTKGRGVFRTGKLLTSTEPERGGRERESAGSGMCSLRCRAACYGLGLFRSGLLQTVSRLFLHAQPVKTAFAFLCNLPADRYLRFLPPPVTSLKDIR